MKIPLTKPFFDSKEERAVIEVLRSGWVTQGPKVSEFEALVCQFTGAQYGVAVTSATTALFLSLHLLGIGPGDEVIVPSFSFIATANVVLQVGAKVVFVDIDPNTYNIDPRCVEKAITKKTKAIIPVHQIGLPADLDRILALGKKYRIHVVQDAACALGSAYKGGKIGSLGELVAFSFHPRKAVTTGEGGMIVTDNSDFYQKLKLLRHHGMSVSDIDRSKSSKIIREHYPVMGYNFRMSDIQAAIGVEQMKKLPSLLKKRIELAERYTILFEGCKNLSTPYVPAGYSPNYQSYIVRLNKKIDRDRLMQKLLDRGISTRIGVMAAHLEPVYDRMFGKLSLPYTEAATRETITIPLYPQMSRKEQDFVIDNIKDLTDG